MKQKNTRNTRIGVKKNLSLMYSAIFLIALGTHSGCKKETVTEEPASLNQVPETTAAVSTATTWTTMGTGSGVLRLGTLANVKIKIKPGTYSNISYDKATNVVIDAIGVKLPKGSVDIANSNNVEFYGFSVTDQSYRAVSIRGLNTALNLHHLTFQNIKDYVITYEYSGLYDGTAKTLNKDSKITNCTFINVSSAVNFYGGFDGSNNIKGMISGFKFLNNTIKDSPVIGSILYVQMGEDIEVAYNIIDNINTKYNSSAPNGVHNGIFSIVGNGSVHDNKCTNHQGNLVRFWGVSVGSTKKKVLVYNNVVWNSWKYSAFELQVPPYLNDVITRSNNRLTYTDAEIYNNSAGQLNNSLDWEGQMLDLYNTYGAVKYYNNLGFKMNRAFQINGRLITKYEGITNMVNFNGNGTSFVQYGNVYLPTVELAYAFKYANLNIGSSIMQF